MPGYEENFPVGSKVKVISKPDLEAFARDWKFHHKLQPEQMAYAGTITTVRKIGYYHGGDVVYWLENVQGIWNEPCLETAS